MQDSIENQVAMFSDYAMKQLSNLLKENKCHE